VVEGYMDVVALFQYGVTQAVATLGTATTPDHAELLFRNAADVYFCFDGDRAGRGAAWKAVESILPRMKDGRQAYFLFLPDGEDPDSIVRLEGADGFDLRLQQATPLSQFFFDELSKDVNLSNMEGKSRLAERAKPMLSVIPDGAFRDLMQQRLGEMTGLRSNAALSNSPLLTNAPHRNTAPPPKLSLVRSAITLLLQKPSLALHIEPPHLFAILRQPGIPLLCELIALIRNRPDINTGLIIESFADREEQASLQKLASQEFSGEPEHWQAEFNDALLQLDKQTRMQRIEELNAKSGRSPDENNELRELLSARMR